jgi:hypothetical protein
VKNYIIVLFFLFSSQIFAADRCQNLFQNASESAAYQVIKEQYTNPSTPFYNSHEGFDFKYNLNQYLRSLQAQNVNMASRIANHPQFIQIMANRLFVLLRRPVSADFAALEKSAISQIDTIKLKTGSYQQLMKEKNNKFSSLQQKREPKIDGKNITQQADVTSWNKATAIIEELALNPKQKMGKIEISNIIAAIKGKEHTFFWPEELVPQNYINFMYTVEKNGMRTLDPTNSFIGGNGKAYLVEQLLDLINNNPYKLHPIVLSAYVRQMTVSIHPISDGNGRLARILSDYVLMKHGYLPAFIPKSTEKVNRSVALFIYKDFENQISSEETRKIQLDGVRNAYNNFLE